MEDICDTNKKEIVSSHPDDGICPDATICNDQSVPPGASGFDLIREVCAGFDVHKKLIVATIAKTDPDTLLTTYHQANFNTNNCSIGSLGRWLSSYGCTDICFESTGKYWIPIYNVLEKAGFSMTLTHPKYVKAIKGKKNDKRDSRWIANLFRFDLVKGSFIPEQRIRMLRDVSRYIASLKHMRTSEKQRFQNCLTMSNLRYDCYLTDPFGKTGKKIIDYLLDASRNGAVPDEREILDLIDPHVKADRNDILDSIRGYRIEADQEMKLNVCRRHLDWLDYRIEELKDGMFGMASEFEDIIGLLTTIPGVGTEAAVRIIAEIGTDMSQFPSSDNLVSWAGLAPALNESARKKKTTRCSSGNQYLKPLLIQCALSAVRDKNPYFKAKHEAIAKRRGRQKATVAIARKILVCIYSMIKKREPFNPPDWDAVYKKSKEKKVVLNTKNAIRFLKEQGLSEESLKILEKEFGLNETQQKSDTDNDRTATRDKADTESECENSKSTCAEGGSNSTDGSDNSTEKAEEYTSKTIPEGNSPQEKVKRKRGRPPKNISS